MRKSVWLVSGLLAVALILGGCSLFSRDFYMTAGDFPDPGTGTLILGLEEIGMPVSKTIHPGDLVVAQYDLVFHSLTTDETITHNDWTAAAVYIRYGFAPGDWEASVSATDGLGFPIGAVGGDPTDRLTFHFNGGDTVIINPVNILPIAGTGDVEITLTWPTELVETPSVLAYLVPPTEASPDTNYASYGSVLTVTVTGNTATLTATGLATGYHSLRLFLRDGAAQVWGYGPEYVRIVNGVETTGGLSLVGTGELNLHLVVDMQNPVQIGWSAPPPVSVEQGESFTITAIPAASAVSGYQYTYKWYADGGATAVDSDATLSAFGAALAVGEHSVVVVVTESKIGEPATIRTISSDGFSFSVVAP